MTTENHLKTESLIPGSLELAELFGTPMSDAVFEVTQSHLLNPVREMLERPSKNFRGDLVRLGFDLARSSSAQDASTAELEQIAVCSEIIELLHAGSLIVDDIEDQSPMRRGKPTLHQIYSLPVALNSGNWLYFWPLYCFERLNLPPEREVLLHRIAHQTLMKAHFGQALDLGAPIDSLPQEKVPGICRASMGLKSGALMAMALLLGAVVGGMDDLLLVELSKLGIRLGTTLQMFDDIGNLTIERDGKRLEDLRNRRPSWIWSVASQEAANEFEEFRRVVALLPEESELQSWLTRMNLVRRATDQAIQEMNSALDQFLEFSNGDINGTAWCELVKLMEKVSHAYR